MIDLAWLEDFFGRLRIVFGATELPRRSKMKFAGTGVASVTDDETNDQLIVTINGGGGGGSGLPITDAAIHGAARQLTAVEHGDDVGNAKDVLCFGSDYGLTPTKTWDFVQFAAKTSLSFFTLDGSGIDISGGALTTLVNNSFVIEGALNPAAISDLLGGGVAVFFFANAQTVPSTNVAGGIIQYVENGVLKYRQPDGTIQIPIRSVQPYNAGSAVPVLAAIDSVAGTRAFITYGPGDAWTVGNSGQDLHLLGDLIEVDAGIRHNYGQRVRFLEKDADYTLVLGVDFHICAIAGVTTITLPASGANGDTYEVSNQSGGAIAVAGNGTTIYGVGATESVPDGESRTYRYNAGSLSGTPKWVIV